MIILRKSCYNLCILLIAMGSIIWLSSRIDVFQPASSQHQNALQNDAVYKIFGQLRKDLAAFCYLKADRYFHRGTHHADKHTQCFDKNTDFAHSHEHGHEHKHDHTSDAKEKEDLFARIEKAIYYRPVVHLQSAENAEIIPWFEVTTEINPQFEKAYLDGSYWLSMKMGMPDKALAFLKKGFRNNPESWQIIAQIGNIYFISKKDYKKACPYFRQAYKLIQTVPHTHMEEKQILTFLSACEDKL